MEGKKETSQTAREQLSKDIFSNTGKTFDGVVNVFTLGMDLLWKHNMIQFLKDVGADFHQILDLACGTGIITYKLAKIFSSAHIVGIDLMEEYLDISRQKRKGEQITFFHLGAENLNELEQLGYRDSFDLIITSGLPKYVDLKTVIAHCDRLLKQEGIILFHDFTLPKNRILRSGWEAYWIGMAPVLRLINGWEVTATRLQSIVKETRWVYELPHILAAHRFENIEVWWQPLQIAAIVTGTKKSHPKHRGN